MGNKQQPKQTLQDTLIQLKINGNKFSRQAAKAMKQSNGNMKKAKQALRKNNQDGAKLYLQSAASKRAQAMNLQRMGVKMQFIGSNMKSMDNNEKVMKSFDKMVQVASQNNPNFELMTKNMSGFEKCMDQIIINAKMMEDVMSQNTTVDRTAERMFQVLKGQLVMQTTNQVNEAGLLKQKQIQFQQNLKKL